MKRGFFSRQKYSPEHVVELARRMRSDMTPEEETLWSRLRRRQVDGLRFRRQRPVGRYIADFYCPDLRLMIEIDGAVHHGREEYDRNRDEYLAGHGYRVVRFSNDDITYRLNEVIETIRRFSKEIRDKVP